MCNEGEIREVAAALKSNGMQSLGYKYINLDDCWAAEDRLENNTITWDVSRFPSGIPALADYLHSEGFLFGLYTSAGNETCSSGGRLRPIPGSRDHHEIDAQTFAAWQVDYIKFDWCGDIKLQLWEGASQHKSFSNAVRATGRDMFLEVVAGYDFLFGEIPKYANSWRFW